MLESLEVKLFDEKEDWDDHFKVNLMSGVELSKYFLPKMIKKIGEEYFI